MRTLIAYMAGAFSVMASIAVFVVWHWLFVPNLLITFLVVSEVPIAAAELMFEGEVHRKDGHGTTGDEVFGWVGLRATRWPPRFEIAWTKPDGERATAADVLEPYPNLSRCIFYLRLDSRGDVVRQRPDAPPLGGGARGYCHWPPR